MIHNNKAAGILLEQVFIVTFGVILLVLIVTVFSNVRDQSVDFIAETQYDFVASSVNSGIILASKNMKFSDYGRLFLELPVSIAGESYKINIINNTTINVSDTRGIKSRSAQLYVVNATILSNTTFTGGGRIYVEYNTTANTIALRAEERVISS